MTPTFCHFFKSFYHSNTYVPAVDFREKALSKHLMKNKETATIAQRLISQPKVQKVLSEPLSYDLNNEVPKKNRALEKRGFTLLSSKVDAATGQVVPFYSVIEHEELEGWVIKSGAIRVPKEQFIMGPTNDRNEMALFTDEESLLRIPMAERIKKVAKEANIDVVIPKKKLVAYANSDKTSEPTQKYCVLSKKIDILSAEDTIQAIKDMSEQQQKEVARKIAILVQKAGIVDASFANIRLTSDGRLVIIDTEPGGLMVAKKAGVRNKLFGPKGASVEKCARIGLFTLMHQTSKGSIDPKTSRLEAQECEPGLESFRAEVQAQYEKAVTPKLSKWKITLSIVSVGLIPLINVIRALAKTKLTAKTFKKLNELDIEVLPTLFLKSSEEKQILLKKYQQEKTSIAKKFYSQIEGVPYQAT